MFKSLFECLFVVNCMVDFRRFMLRLCCGLLKGCGFESEFWMGLWLCKMVVNVNLFILDVFVIGVKWVRNGDGG